MKRANSNHLVILTLGGVLTLAGVWMVRTSEAPDVANADVGHPTRERSLFARRAVAAAGAEGRLCSFEPGARMAYDVVSETDVDVDFDRLSSEVDIPDPNAQVVASPAEQHIVDRRWHLELVALRTSGEGDSVLAARIEDRGTTIVGQPEPVDSGSAQLSETFLIRVGSDCSLREFGWRSDSDLEAAREQQIMAAGLNFSGPPSTLAAHRYGGIGFDATGQYRASYRYADGQIEGDVVAYALGGQSQAPVDVEILGSAISVELGVGVWFESLTNTRELELGLYGRSFGTHVRSTTAKRVAPGSFEPKVTLDDGGWSWGRVALAARDSSQDFDPTLREVAIDDILDRYLELADGGKIGEYGGLLRDWLRANPERTGDLLARLRAGDFDDHDHARAGLFFALGSANTDAAGRALEDVLREWPSRGQQIAAAQALSMVERPSLEMVELVALASAQTEWHPIERGSMALALGAVAKGRGAASDEVVAQARGQILDWLETPASDEQVTHGLLAAGNAGADELATSVGAYIDHDSTQVRKQATRALRQMSPDAAYPHLEQALADEQPAVVSEALHSAASVTRLHDRAPSEAIVDLAAQHLASAGAAERDAAIELLGEAVERGNASAETALRARLQDQLASGELDARQIAALGRSTPSQWRRPN